MQIVHQTIFMRVNNIYIKRRKTIFTCIRQKYSKIHKRFQKFLIQYLVLDPYWQISGAWARPISGKLIQQSILEFWGMTRVALWKTHPKKFDEFRGVTQTDFWKTHPDILQKLNRYSQKTAGWIFQKSADVRPQNS